MQAALFVRLLSDCRRRRGCGERFFVILRKRRAVVHRAGILRWSRCGRPNISEKGKLFAAGQGLNEVFHTARPGTVGTGQAGAENDGTTCAGVARSSRAQAVVLGQPAFGIGGDAAVVRTVRAFQKVHMPQRPGRKVVRPGGWGGGVKRSHGIVPGSPSLPGEEGRGAGRAGFHTGSHASRHHHTTRPMTCTLSARSPRRSTSMGA